MSKRSGLSRLEDLKRGFIDIGRYRYILHKIDMEPWRDQFCPICEMGFSQAPQHHIMGYVVHNDCAFTEAYEKWWAKFYAEEEKVWSNYDGS